MDGKGNVKPEDLKKGAQLAISVSKLDPVRDIDWKSSPPRGTCLTDNQQAVGAHGQRCGDIVPFEKSCRSCQRGNRPFASCVVLSSSPAEISWGRSLLGRGCMNCYVKAYSSSCTLCKLLSSHHMIFINQIPDPVHGSQGTGAGNSQTQADGGAVSALTFT